MGYVSIKQSSCCESKVSTATDLHTEVSYNHYQATFQAYGGQIPDTRKRPSFKDYKAK